jgi:alpha-L-fucosidase 2
VVVRVKAAQPTVTLVKGQSVRVAAVAYLSDGAKATVTWKSSKPSVAKVAANGKITAKKAGKTVLTIGSASGKTAKIRITVLAAKPAKAKVTKVSATVPQTMPPGQTRAVTGKYAPARAVKAKVSYRSSDPAVASIDSCGMLTAHKAGKTIIRVKAGAKTKSYTLTVK